MSEPRPAQWAATAARGVGVAVMFGAAAFALVPGCLERRAQKGDDSDAGRCATCHGDPTRGGDYLARAAPPRDLLGTSAVGNPGVGAHADHLHASKTHGALACGECHTVPTRSDSPGHADDARPAEIVFGEQARREGRHPRYDSVGRTCSGSSCHGDQSDAVWTEPRTSPEACGSCHGLPPAAPHPQSERCAACHGDVIDAARDFIAPALHVDGIVQVGAASCGACHGHGDDPAPPPDTRGNQARSAIGVGAHAAHLSGGAFSRPLACDECHVVPTGSAVDAHPDGLVATVSFAGVAASFGHQPTWQRTVTSCSDTWCHGPGAGQHEASPSWLLTQPLGCTSCHGAPPPAPHTQLGNCNGCHSEVVGSDNVSIVNRLRHVDGVVDVAFDAGCTTCHGGDTPAPPRDLAGHSATSFPGVGAHQAHLGPSARSRPVPCAECHVVPANTFAIGHLDSASPAEVSFSGAAAAFQALPVYANGACSQTACHGGKFPGTHRSGGSNVAPEWTKVDGTQATCGSCHALPPPPPHPYASDCRQCHEDVATGNAAFVHPELHVDGIVTFTVP